jgi:hypothetical protein
MSKLCLVLAISAPIAFSGCSKAGQSAPAGGPSATAGTSADGGPSATGRPQAASGTGVVAEVNGGAILASELEQRVGNRLIRLRQEEYETRSQVLDELIAERLVAAEAQKRGLSAEELL